MGGKTTINAPKPDYTPMLKIIEQMKADQAMAAQQSAAAQERALADAQNTAAQLGMQQSNTAAMQDFLRQQQLQQAEDEAAKRQNIAATSTMGRDIVGPAFDVNAANQARLSGLAGVAGGFLPTMANYSGFGFDFMSPQAKQRQSKPLNKFTVPQQTALEAGD